MAKRKKKGKKGWKDGLKRRKKEECMKEERENSYTAFYSALLAMLVYYSITVKCCHDLNANFH